MEYQLFIKKTFELIMFTTFFNISKFFNNLELPDDWKRDNVVPVFKGKGNKYDVNKHKPISLTSIIGKVKETIIYNHITEYCEKYKLLHSAQHGFRNKHSITSNLLELLNNLTYYINNGHSVDPITIDFPKPLIQSQTIT